MKSAADWAANYKQGMAGAGTAYSAGVDRVTVSPTSLAADQIGRMQAGLMAAFASGYTERRLRATTNDQWKTACKTKGATALAASGARGAVKLASYAQIAQPIFAQAQADIATMPKGGRANAMARIQRQLDAADAAKQQYRANK